MLSKLFKMGGLVVAFIIVSSLFSRKPAPAEAPQAPQPVTQAAAGKPAAAHAVLQCSTQIQFGERTLNQRWTLGLELPERMTLLDMSSPRNTTMAYAPVTEKDGLLEGENEKGMVLGYMPATREITLHRRGDTQHVSRGRCE